MQRGRIGLAVRREPGILPPGDTEPVHPATRRPRARRDRPCTLQEMSPTAQSTSMRTRSLRTTLVFSGVVLTGLALDSLVAPVDAGTITYVTLAGFEVPPTPGLPVSASAMFTTSRNTLTIVLTDLLANPTDVGQSLSGLSFTLGNGGSLSGVTTLSSSSAREITIASNGTFTTGSTGATGWVPTLSGASGKLDDLTGTGHAGPSHTIIGPPGADGIYNKADGSIAGNGPNNSFLDQSATFTFTGSTLTANTTITSATFWFGTTSGVMVVGHSVSVPEPSSLVLYLLVLGSLSVVRGPWSVVGAAAPMRRRRLSSSASTVPDQASQPASANHGPRTTD